MAITRSFGGQTLLKPGAYSVSRVDNAQSLNVGDNDTIMLIGEATNGTSSNSLNGEGTSRVFNSANVQSLVDYYISGDIVDAALAAVRPSLTAGVSGPGQFVVYKTNVGTVATATFTIDDTVNAGDIFRVRVPVNASGEMADVDLIWGTDIVITGAVPADTSNLVEALNASPALMNFFTAVQPDGNTGVVNLTAVKQGPQFNSIQLFTLTSSGSFADYSDITTDGNEFDNGISNLGASETSQLAESFADAFNFDPNVIVPLWSNSDTSTITAGTGTSALTGTPASGDTYISTITYTPTGGTPVSSTISYAQASGMTLTQIAEGFVSAWNANPVLSADFVASGTVADTINFATTSTKTSGDANYNIAIGISTAVSGTGTFIAAGVNITGSAASVIAAGSPNAGTAFRFINAQIAANQLQSHLIQRSSTSVRKEAQGMVGGRFADWRASFDANAVGGMNGFSGVTSFLIQAFIQDVRIINSIGTLEWKAPHILAAMAAGIRLGTTVGEPLTFKFVNANNVAHHVNTSTGNFSGSVQFKPGFDFNVAIQNGITFTELASGGSRIVVDNTRYVTDDSFIFNRGSVIEAAQFVAKSSRQLLERIFVGNKVSNGAALSLKNVLRNYLIELNADNIITSSTDAPFGFVEDTFTVSINGNTADIQVEIKPVQGLDFIFINFTLGNITQQA